MGETQCMGHLVGGNVGKQVHPLIQSVTVAQLEHSQTPNDGFVGRLGVAGIVVGLSDSLRVVGVSLERHQNHGGLGVLIGVGRHHADVGRLQVIENGLDPPFDQGWEVRLVIEGRAVG